MQSAPVKVLLVDDDEDDFVITLELLADIPVGRFELEWAATAEAGLLAIQDNRPDVCLVDYRMGTHSGLDFMRRALERGLEVPMIMMTGQGDHEIDVEATRLGAADYLVKGEVGPALLERTLRHAMHRAAEQKSEDAELLRSFPQLSERELDVAGLIAGGCSNKEIATSLSIGVPTIKKHVGRLLKKAGLQDRLQLGLFLARNPLALRRAEPSCARA